MSVDFRKYLVSLDNDIHRAIDKYDEIIGAKSIEYKEKAKEEYEFIIGDMCETIYGLKSSISLIR